MSKAISLTDLLSELAADPSLYDEEDEHQVYWGDVDDLPCRNRHSCGFYSSMRLRVEPMYHLGDEVGFVSVTTKNRIYRPYVETVGELHDQPKRV